MNTAPVESLHGSFGSARIVKLNEAVVVSFTVELLRELVHELMYLGLLTNMLKMTHRTHVLIRDDLHADNVSSSLKDLFQDILSDPLVKTANIKSSFVWLWGSSAHVPAGAGWGHHVPRHRRCDRRGNRIGILRNHNRRTRGRRHMRRIGLAVTLGSVVLLTWSSRGLRRRRESRRSLGGYVISHC